MMRFHVHISVKDLEESVRFYAAMFGTEPTVRKDDYAKWMVEDPRINFAISARGEAVGINHLGLQVDSQEELAALREQTGRAEVVAFDQPNARCCYSRSDKYWTTDPQGVAWETFHTLESIPVFGSAQATKEQSVCYAADSTDDVATNNDARGACCA
jgi:catechol 2,3-dioxygenase-like lactoylglutathione lyase family enzyme